MHYMRWRKWGSPYYKARAANGEYKGCKIPYCNNPHYGHGYCDAHYRRLKRHRRLVDLQGCLLIRE